MTKQSKVTGIALSALLYALLLSCSDGLPAQSTAAKTVKTVKKQATKVIKRATKKARGAAKQAANSTLSAVHNLPSPGWEKLTAAYDYPQDTIEMKEDPQQRDDAVQINLSFTGPSGKTVQGIFLRPKADKAYPCALVLHGLTNNKEIALKMFGARLLKNGVAILALDAPEHGKGEPKNKSYWNQPVIEVAVHEGVRNYRSALDWLVKRDDIDPARIGALGYSLGSITSVILGAVDNRVSAFSLCVGGDPFLPVAQVESVAQQQSAFAVSPSLFVSHLAGRPILFQNGRKDAVIVQPAAMLLHNAAKDPKTVAWYNGGHDLPDAVRARAVDWMVKRLSTAAPQTKSDTGADQSEAKPEAKP